MLAERDRIAAGMATRVGAVGPPGGRPDRHLRDRDQRRRAPARRPRVRAACRAGRRATACPGRRVRGRRGPERVRHPADGRLRRGPGEHRAGELRRGRDRPGVRRAARRVDLRAHLQLPVGPGAGRSGRAGRRGRRPAWWRAPGRAEFEGPDGQRVAFPRTGTGFGRAVGIDALVERARVRPGAGVVRRAALGVRRRGPGGAHLGRPGHRGPVRARRRRPARRAGPRARAAAGPRVGRRPHRRGVRLGRAARRLPLRPGTAGRGGRTGGRAPLRARTARAGWRR